MLHVLKHLSIHLEQALAEQQRAQQLAQQQQQTTGAAQPQGAAAQPQAQTQTPAAGAQATAVPQPSQPGAAAITNTAVLVRVLEHRILHVTLTLNYICI